MLVAYDETLTQHLAGIPHVERPDRVRVAAEVLARRGMLGERIDTRRATAEEIARAHDPDYVALVEAECRRLDDASFSALSTGDTEIDASSYEGALRAAGGTLAALERVIEERRAAFALVRPPGHHAEAARGMGFCVFNNAVVAARAFGAQTAGVVLIADFDYHHGNGTQNAVGGGLSYLSTHASPAYPGTGDPRDNRTSREGALLNVPIAASGIDTEGFHAIWWAALRGLAARVRPQLLIVSAGYDFVAGDPLGDLGVSSAVSRQLGRLAREVAEEWCEGRALFLLEGGYDPFVLAECIADTIAGYEEGTPAEKVGIGAIPDFQRAIVDEVAL